MVEEADFEGGIHISLCFSLLLYSIKLTVASPDSFLQGLLHSSLAPLTELFTLAYVSLAVF